MLVAQLCLTLCDPVDCSPQGSSVHGILQARILAWVAIFYSWVSSQPRDRIQVSCIAGRLSIFTQSIFNLFIYLHLWLLLSNRGLTSSKTIHLWKVFCMPGKYSNVQSSRRVPASRQTHFPEWRKGNTNTCRRDLLQMVPGGHDWEGTTGAKKKEPSSTGGRAEIASCGISAAWLLSLVQPRTATTQGLGTGRAARHRHSWRRPETLGLGKRALRQRQGSACLCHPKHFCRGKKLLRSNAPCPEPVTHKCPDREWSVLPYLTDYRLFFISPAKGGHRGRNTGQGGAVAVLWYLSPPTG